ncbi:putative mitochondrial chaperone BCS1-B [Colletotrichum tanaceti]|uniref:Putative mitochondrial chaperone BCS1-B n=1 Tax=Colletotrichum tanaceti TaxID=1306861 RepID=A0A4V6DG34_9PEZI|nr:putative mitochondrial chaperone BCS1-B [Colletotrichum tanaceti]TKW50976.1 putative mitochondrial chaperone BCS1-B [Colletotrichum tanaceti]
MSDISGLTKASFLSGAGGATAKGLHDFLDRTAPGYGALSRFFSTWLRLDLTTIVLLISFGGEIPRALTGLQNLGAQIYWWITRFFTASISIGSKDKLNREVLNWLGAHVLTKKGTRILTARTEVIQNEAWYFRKPVQRDDLRHEKRVPVQYLPTFGTTWFVHKGGFFMVRRVPTRNLGSAYVGIPDEYVAAPEGNEPLVVLRLGRAIQPVKAFLDDCRLFADKQREAFITVRATKNEHHQISWDTTILRPIRTLDTVHLDDGTKEELVADIETYLHHKTRRFYTERGIPYRRGYLFHGPPGTGKTSLSLALAGRFNLELYLLHIPSIRDDSDLENLFTALPPKCIVLLEDIDAIGIQRRKKVDSDDSASDDSSGSGSDEDKDGGGRPVGRCRCTLSGLLNVLDGVASQEGRIVLMTSNLAHKLDKALVRPGRIDKMVYMGRISSHSARGMFERMYRPPPQTSTEGGAAALSSGGGPGGDDAELAKNRSRSRSRNRDQNRDRDQEEEGFDALSARFSRQVPDDVFTPAQLQGYLLRHRNSPNAAIDRLQAWIAEEKAAMEEAQRRRRASAERRSRRKKRKAQRKAKGGRRDPSSSSAKREGTREERVNGAGAETARKVPEETAKDKDVAEKHKSAQADVAKTG